MLGLIGREIEEISYMSQEFPVPPELRGWSWYMKPVRPRYRLGLGVSNVAYYSCCPTEAIESRQGVRGPSRSMALGAAVHELFRLVVTEFQWLTSLRPDPLEAADRLLGLGHYLRVAKDYGLGYEDAAGLRDLERALAYSLAADELAQRLLGLSAWSRAPWVSELTVDGSLLGLSRRLRPDALLGNVIVEVKYARPRNWHRVQLAGYALALESRLMVPFNFGALIYVTLSPPGFWVSGVYLDEDLRYTFLRARDSMAEELAARAPAGN